MLESVPQTQSHEDLAAILAMLPPTIWQKIDLTGRTDELLEVVLDLGRRPAARYVDGELILRDDEVTQEEIDLAVGHIGQFDDDNRAGIARTLHRISAIRNRRGHIVGLTCRVGRAVYGTLDIIADLVEEGKSMLFLGRPGVGKTTMLREMARVLSSQKRVIIVDTSNEIGGDGDIPHPAVGRARRMQVPKPSHQHETMIEAVENHSPEVIIIDEIGREREAEAARTINERGVQLIGTAHGNTLENLLLNPILADLVGGIESVTLSDEEARRRGTQKTVLERRAPPTFDVLIEIQDRQRLAIHRDVAAAVDAMLRGRPMGVELRYRDGEGKIHLEREESVATAPPLTNRRGQRLDSRPEPHSRPEQSNGGLPIPLPEPAVVVSSGRNLPSRKAFAYGVSRNRLLEAAQILSVGIEIVEEVSEADFLITLKSYYRRRRRIISDAEQKQIPIYVLRANTTFQMQEALGELFGLEVKPADPFDAAIAEAERAIQRIYAGEDSVDLSPAGANLRRYQHQMARQANLVSHSYGHEPNRHVRIFNSKRN